MCLLCETVLKQCINAFNLPILALERTVTEEIVLDARNAALANTTSNEPRASLQNRNAIGKLALTLGYFCSGLRRVELSPISTVLIDSQWPD